MPLSLPGQAHAKAGRAKKKKKHRVAHKANQVVCSRGFPPPANKPPAVCGSRPRQSVRMIPPLLSRSLCTLLGRARARARALLPPSCPRLRTRLSRRPCTPSRRCRRGRAQRRWLHLLPGPRRRRLVARPTRQSRPTRESRQWCVRVRVCVQTVRQLFCGNLAVFTVSNVELGAEDGKEGGAAASPPIFCSFRVRPGNTFPLRPKKCACTHVRWDMASKEGNARASFQQVTDLACPALGVAAGRLARGKGHPQARHLRRGRVALGTIGEGRREA